MIRTAIAIILAWLALPAAAEHLPNRPDLLEAAMFRSTSAASNQNLNHGGILVYRTYFAYENQDITYARGSGRLARGAGSGRANFNFKVFEPDKVARTVKTAMVSQKANVFVEVDLQNASGTTHVSGLVPGCTAKVQAKDTNLDAAADSLKWQFRCKLSSLNDVLGSLGMSPARQAAFDAIWHSPPLQGPEAPPADTVPFSLKRTATE
jgi:hypothetical protein